MNKHDEEQLEQLCDTYNPYSILTAVTDSYSSTRKTDVINHMIEYLQDEGYITIKPSNLLEQEQVENFIVQLKPHYNERQYLFI
jgi:ribosomal protein S8